LSLDAYEQLATAFQREFGADPEVITRAPGRVNLIGEHTDYNDGFVLPVAIDREIRVAVRRRPDAQARLLAINLGRRSSFDVRDIHHDPSERWSHYERGVVLMLRQRGYDVGGFELAIEGDLPSGAGLSSSAAVEVATGLALDALFGFVGVKSGIMDQFIAALGRRDTALFLDCRSLETRHVPIPPAPALPMHPQEPVRIVVADTTVKRGLVDSEYNRRRAECEEAVRRLAQHLPGTKALRDVTLEQFMRYAAELPETVRKRARHVIAENERVLASVAALERGDLDQFGRLMYESHASLHDDYEVTIPQLDVLVEAARAVPGVFGSRMTGAGFGGCTVSLVRESAVATFEREVPAAYRARTGLDPKIYVCRAVDGASIIRP
jgi:galactokinase